MNLRNIFPLKMVRAVSVFVLLFAVSACQTTGIDATNLKTQFASDGWSMHKKGKVQVYECRSCKTPQFVLIDPIKVRGDVEEAIRANVLSKELMNAVANVIKVASKGAYQASPVKKIATPTYSGFEIVGRFKTGKGMFYVASRSIIQQNRGSNVVSIASNRGVAVRNLKRFFATSKITRGK
ncbi:hypothetical protein [Cohaesibacter celericrescens]|uniref:Uncharacterized protein n=1 Tax=Cohaesibacter celericrescens TaxID=2067669 RepID=A0A2N5XMC7_9HYPH|nr:hypothetical protein [Cohaesibacter celericrescens]PLW75590.1 hypothetical protein C0081_18220 [Cohaesibacter celericrescens]